MSFAEAILFIVAPQAEAWGFCTFSSMPNQDALRKANDLTFTNSWA